MNKLFEKLYKGEIDIMEEYGLPQNEIFRKQYKKWQDELSKSEEELLNKIEDSEETYTNLIANHAVLGMLETNAMFIEGVRVGLDLRGREVKVKAIIKAKGEGEKGLEERKNKKNEKKMKKSVDKRESI